MLTKNQLEDIKSLQSVCEQEGYQLKLNWDMLKKRSEIQKDDFFHYEDGELVGFLALYDFGGKVEICGMVHPNHRRRGIFSDLMESGLEEVNKRVVTTVLLNAPANSLPAKEFLKTLPCMFSTAEYQMKWEGMELTEDKSVLLRPSVSEEDQEAEIQLDIQAFGFKEAEARQYSNRLRRDEPEQMYIIEVGGEVKGKIRLSSDKGETWIYGFAIFPRFQGKGIGRKVLANVVVQENKKGNGIFLEVEAKNNHALKLYESCGFRAYYQQDYYELSRS